VTVPLLLLAVALFLGLLAGGPLARAAWPASAPRQAVALWHSLSLAVVSSAVLAGVALALPSLPAPITGGLTGFLSRCAMALRAEYASPGSLLLASAGAILALLARLGYCMVAASRASRRLRQEQRTSLDLVGTPGADRAVLVVAEDRPAVYCLPGRRRRDGRIVLSTGAVERLTSDQLRLVLAHERAHLHQRHHLAVQLSSVLATAFGFVPLFRHAASQVPLLLEMAADDDALRTAPRRASGRADARLAGRRGLAHALVALAAGNAVTPAGALGAVGSSALPRVARLSQPEVRLGVTRGGALAVLVGLALTGPLLIAAAPALCAAAMEFCPFVFAA